MAKLKKQELPEFEYADHMPFHHGEIGDGIYNLHCDIPEPTSHERESTQHFSARRLWSRKV